MVGRWSIGDRRWGSAVAAATAAALLPQNRLSRDGCLRQGEERYGKMSKLELARPCGRDMLRDWLPFGFVTHAVFENPSLSCCHKFPGASPSRADAVKQPE